MKLALISGNVARLNTARRLAGQHGIETEVFCGPDMFGDEGVHRMENDDFISFFVDEARLGRFDAVLAIDYPETPEGPLPVPAFFVDFDVMQMIFMDPEKTRDAYAALLNMFEENGKLVLQFPEALSLGKGSLRIASANVICPDAEKTGPLFCGMELPSVDPAPQEFFYFEMPKQMQNVEFQFVNGGYVRYQVELER